MPPLISPRNVARELLLVPRSSTSQFPTLVQRLAEDVSTVPEGYGHSPNGPDSGTVAGIVLGSVAGFLVVIWLIYTCINLGNSSGAVVEEGSVGSVVTRKSRRHRHAHHHHHHHSPRRETVEIRTSERERVVEPPIIVPPPPPSVERIVVEEERIRTRGPPMPTPPPPPPPMMDDDDEVVVIEEHSPPRRRESRQHRRRSSERRSGGYRDIDPYQYAGGDGHVRSINRHRSNSHRRSR